MILLPAGGQNGEKKKKLPLAKGEKLCYGVCITIEVAEAKSPEEPAGWESGGGKSAESRCRARLWDGDGENISATVRGRNTRGCAICLRCHRCAKSVGSACRLFLLENSGRCRISSKHHFQEERTWTSAI